MNRLLTVLLSILFLLMSMPEIMAEDSDWPRTVRLDTGTITLYPLQVDEKEGDILRYRAALAYRETTDSEPIFGAGWFESQVTIDQASQVVRPNALTLTETRFPQGTQDLTAELSSALARESAGWNLDFSVDELQAALKQAEAESLAVDQLNTSPPRIIYRDHPALLVSLDGEPVLREIEDSEYQAVINTPYPLIYDGNRYYLNAAKDVWYQATDATGPYRFDAAPPVEIAAMVKPEEDEAEEGGDTGPVTASNAPEIVVSTKPAELIVTDGPAAFVPLVDDLLVLQNSDDDVFMHVGSQQYYVVLAGRWYHSGSLDGPWDYQAADKLPLAFAEIPENSDQADSRVHVAGTEEAREAVLDAQVPQTAAVARGEVDIDVDYDGNPEFETVDGTDMEYAQNTGSTVLESNGLYYLVEDGVWYVAASPNGPWQVADYRPQQVASIMPTSPVYNVKYVHVYDSTPQVVYVGYTPGYLGSYVHYNTIFYGSGWYYRPWVSPYTYYPRHSTWGWNVSYNSWTGWNFGLSWGWGPFNVHYFSGGYWHNNHYWHHRHYGRWGPRGYRPRHYARNGRGYNRRGHGGYGRGYDSHGRKGRGDGGYRGDDRGRDGRGSGSGQRHDNLYRDSGQRALIADTRDNQRRSPGTGRSSDGMERVAYRQPSSATGKSSSPKNQMGNRIEPVNPGASRVTASMRDSGRSGKRSPDRGRAEPVTVSELGDKARARDRNDSRKGTPTRSHTEPVRVADLSSKAVARDQNRNVKGKSSRNRTEPVRVADLSSKAVARDQNRNVKSQSSRNRTEPVRTSDVRQKAKQRDSGISTGKQPRLADNRSTGQRQKSNTQTAPQPVNRSSYGRSGRQVDSSAKRSRSQVTPVQSSNAPIPLPQYRTRTNTSQQRSSSGNSRSGPRQAGNRPRSAPQSTPVSSRGNAPTAPRSGKGSAPQKGASRSGGSRSGASKGSNRRSGSGRSQ